jgi:exodeoxyribonuclease-5
MEWGKQQSDALADVRAWLVQPRGKQIFRLFGYAGCGKTTLAKEIATMVRGRVQYCAYTGKAALVLRSKGCFNASTIHGLIYKPEDGPDGKPVFVLNRESPISGAGLVIIDECSMVAEELARDLLSFGTRVLVLGDPAQLPPVKGGGYFTECEPDRMLTDIHRQALDNPIVAMSMRVREGGDLELGSFGESKVIRRKDLEPGEVMAADQVLCGLNNTRRGLNQKFRTAYGFEEDYPHHGDRLVCLKNDRKRQLFNGGLWTAEDVTATNRFVKMNVRSCDEGGATGAIAVDVPVEYFHGTEESLPYHVKRNMDAFDYGYALTVHKSQGSQWQHVMVFDESMVFREHRARHLYTAITRAAEKITVVI